MTETFTVEVGVRVDVESAGEAYDAVCAALDAASLSHEVREVVDKDFEEVGV